MVNIYEEPNLEKLIKEMEEYIKKISELSKEEPCHYVLSVPKKNKYKTKFAKDFINLVQTSSLKENVSEMYACAYSFSTTKIKDDKGNVWFELSNLAFEKKVANETRLLAADKYQEVKDMNKMSTAVVTTLIEQGDVQNKEAEIIENPEF